MISILQSMDLFKQINFPHENLRNLKNYFGKFKYDHIISNITNQAYHISVWAVFPAQSDHYFSTSSRSNPTKASTIAKFQVIDISQLKIESKWTMQMIYMKQ